MSAGLPGRPGSGSLRPRTASGSLLEAVERGGLRAVVGSTKVPEALRPLDASSFGADIKWNPVRGDFDLALAPGFQVARLSSGDVSGTIGYINAPLILGFNPTDWLSLVPTVGATMAFTSAEDLSTNDAAITGTGFLLRTGFGASFRVSEGFAIQPEVTGLIDPETGGVFLSYGVGFNFGELPAFGGE